MPYVRMITLFGPRSAKESARITLENQPIVRRIDILSHPYELRLITDSPIDDVVLVSLLASSGISGFRMK